MNTKIKNSELCETPLFTAKKITSLFYVAEFKLLNTFL